MLTPTRLESICASNNLPIRDWMMGPAGENPTKDAAALLARPEVRSLVDFARSGNPLVDLGIERREVCWTRYMESRLDPLRSSHAEAQCYLQAFVDRLGGGKVNAIESAAAEVAEGDAGRSDLVVRYQMDGMPTVLVVENKIDTSERKDQLAGYLRRYKNHVIGLLLELGDRPTGCSTAPDAVCWGRTDVVGWLSDVVSRLDEPHRLTLDYLALLRTWDAADRVRSAHFTAIESLEQSGYAPEEWSLVRRWLVADDTPFFDTVLRCPVVARVLAAQALEPEQVGRMRADHGILKLSQDGWTLYPNPSRAEGVNVHFECRGRSRLQLHVEPDPYEGSLEKKPERMVALAAVLQLKTHLLERLRRSLVEQLGEAVSLRYCPPANRPGTCKAVGFPPPDDVGTTAESFAEFLADRIALAAPVIEAELEAVSLSGEELHPRPL